MQVLIIMGVLLHRTRDGTEHSIFVMDLRLISFIRRDDNFLFELSCNAIDHLSQVLANYKRDLLGLEALYQLTGNAILLFYSMSDTRTSQSLTAMFQEDNLLGLPVSTFVAITISFLWSLISYTNAHAACLGGHRDYFPFVSKFILTYVHTY